MATLSVLVTLHAADRSSKQSQRANPQKKAWNGLSSILAEASFAFVMPEMLVIGIRRKHRFTSQGEID